MNTSTTAALLVAVVSLVATVLVLLPPSHSGMVVCPSGNVMYITSGTQLSEHCINTPSDGFNGMFYRKNELDGRRYMIAQREWNYGGPSVIQGGPYYFNNDVRQYE